MKIGNIVFLKGQMHKMLNKIFDNIKLGSIKIEKKIYVS